EPVQADEAQLAGVLAPVEVAVRLVPPLRLDADQRLRLARADVQLALADGLLARHGVLVLLQGRAGARQRVDDEQLLDAAAVLAGGVEVLRVLRPGGGPGQDPRARRPAEPPAAAEAAAEGGRHADAVVLAAVLRELDGLLILADLAEEEVVVLDEE